MFVAATGAYKSDPDFFTFPIYLLRKDLTKIVEKKFVGSPRFSPSKKVAQENDPTMTAYDPHFSSQTVGETSKTWSQCLFQGYKANFMTL